MKLTIDLNSAALLGPMCKFFEFLPGYKKMGYEVELLNKDWNLISSLGTGTTFNKGTGSFNRGSSRYLWDPNTHPRDLLENLVLPSFDNINLVDTPISNNNFIEKLKKYYSYAFSRNTLTYFDYGYKFLEKKDANTARKEKKY